jgi:hypothetical protein
MMIATMKGRRIPLTRYKKPAAAATTATQRAILQPDDKVI